MGRKLTKGEKRLLLLLITAVLGCVYYFVFWDNINKKIEANKTEISILQMSYNDYHSKINSLDDLKKQLNDILSQPAYIDRFYAADELQEAYMDFLNELIHDNELDFESIVFSTDRIELPVIEAPADANSERAPEAYFNISSATITFNIVNEEQLLNVLETIEKNEKMTIVTDLTLDVQQVASNTRNRELGSNIAMLSNEPTAKGYKCNMVIRFVNLVASREDRLLQPEDISPSFEEQAAQPEGDGSAQTANAESDGVLDVEVSVDTVLH